MNYLTCDPSDTRILWRGLELARSGDPCFTMETTVEGLGSATPEQENTPLSIGASPGPLRFPPRDIIVTRVLTRTKEARDALRSAMVPNRVVWPEELVFTEWTHDEPRLIYAHARRMDASVNRSEMVTRGYTFDLLWTALDPRVYAVNETLFDITEDTPVSHEGTYNAVWRAELPGPFSGPRIWSDNGLDWWWPDVVIPDGQSLVVDFRLMTAFVGDVDVWGRAIDDMERPALAWTVPPSVTSLVSSTVPGAKMWVRDTWL